MNAARRKELDKARELIDEARAIIGDVLSEEQEAFENLPESLQTGERGEAMEAAIERLNDAESGCDDVLSALEEAAA